MIRVSSSLDPDIWRPDILLGLIWVQTVCKSYQQTTLGDNELNSVEQSWAILLPHASLCIFHSKFTLMTSALCVYASMHVVCRVEGYVSNKQCLTLNAPIATKVLCFSRLLKYLRSLFGKQCGPRPDCSYIGAVCSRSTLFAFILNLSIMLGKDLQKTTSADNIFRCIFFLAL